MQDFNSIKTTTVSKILLNKLKYHMVFNGLMNFAM